MGKLQKGFSMTVGVMASLCLVTGIGVSVVSWVIAGKAPTSISAVDIGTLSYGSKDISFRSYWWGGIGFIIPGILGMIAGFTRNSCVMIFYLIFNIICLIASLAMSVVVALLATAWAVVNTELNSVTGGCVNKYLGGVSCVCADLSGTIVSMGGVTCESIRGIHMLLATLVGLGAISALLAFIAAYISCCSLCNQEHEPTVIIQPTMLGNVQQQQNMGLPPQQQQYMAYPPPQQQSSVLPPTYNESAPGNYLQPYNVSSKDKAKLMNNQVI